MVSRRNFISICTMMLVLLFLFLFFQVVKEQENNFDVNEYAVEDPLLGENCWTMAESKEQLKEEDYVLYLGKQDSQVGKVIQSWCSYSKKQLYVAEAFDLQMKEELPVPQLVLLNCEEIEVTEMTNWLEEMTMAGVDVVFCNLPEAQKINDESQLKKLLGIAEVKRTSVKTEGIHLFSGFLVGGEAIYKAQTEKEEKLQDLTLDMPWYTTGSGVTIYMVGMLDEQNYKREEFPPIIWKNRCNNASVFAINGDYMDDLIGFGILSAIEYQTKPYTIYPVINAHNVMIANYPGFAEENAKKVQNIYSRSVAALYRDVIWPGLSALSDKTGMKMTFSISPQYQYSDELEPSGEDLVFYLRQMKEIQAEAGLSLDYAGDTTLEEKLNQDKAFFESLGSSYRYSAYCTPNECPQELDSEFLAQNANVRTISCMEEDDSQVVSYLNENVTRQLITGDASEYTFSENLLFRSLETALGYSNVMVDISKAVWPESQKQQWENYFDDMSSNLSTYWTPYHGYDSTTLTESDNRVRSFLNLDYSFETKEQKIKLSASNFGEEAWFVFRSHGDDIVKITGGDFRKIEENVFLIHVISEEVEIELETSKEEPEYAFPGEAGN